MFKASEWVDEVDGWVLNGWHGIECKEGVSMRCGGARTSDSIVRQLNAGRREQTTRLQQGGTIYTSTKTLHSLHHIMPYVISLCCI